MATRKWSDCSMVDKGVDVEGDGPVDLDERFQIIANEQIFTVVVVGITNTCGALRWKAIDLDRYNERYRARY